jgi:hypothetical protein
MEGIEVLWRWRIASYLCHNGWHAKNGGIGTPHVCIAGLICHQVNKVERQVEACGWLCVSG